VAVLHIPQGVRATITPSVKIIRLKNKPIFFIKEAYTLFFKTANEPLFYISILAEKGYLVL
jgi:hypothetical protein